MTFFIGWYTFGIVFLTIMLFDHWKQGNDIHLADIMIVILAPCFGPLCVIPFINLEDRIVIKGKQK